VAKQLDGWINMKLGMQVGLGPGHIVLGGVPAPPPRRGTAPPIFGPFMLWPNGWLVDQDATWYGGRPHPRRHCVRWGPISPNKRGDCSFFDPCVVAKWLDLGMEVGLSPGHIVLDGDPAPSQFSAHVYCSQLVAHLSYC